MQNIYFFLCRNANLTYTVKQCGSDEASDECPNSSPRSFTSADTDDCFIKGIAK